MNEIIKKISERVEEKIKKEYPEVEITETSMIKTNDKEMIGITVRNNGELVAPVYWLNETAIENTKRKGHVVMHISKVLGIGKEGQIVNGKRYGLAELEAIKFFVVTNTKMSQGAIIPFISEEARMDLRDKIGGDYYLIPSSIHECLALEAKGKSVADLKQLVMEVNENEVAERDVLSDRVYFVGEDLKVMGE